MAYPNTDWPTSVDAARVVVDQDTIYPGDFNFQDGQIRAIQGWLGVDGDLIGEGGTSTQGPGGLASPIADGGTAVTLAAKADFTSGKLLSIGDNYDTAYSEKASVDFEGKAVFAGIQLGATTAVTSILDEDTMTSDSAVALATQQSIKAYVDAAVAVENLWDKAGTVLSPNTSGDTIAVGVGAVGAPGVAFEGAATTGLYLDSSEVLTSIAGSKTAGITKSANLPYLSLYRVDTHGSGVDVGYLTFRGKDASAADAEYARLTGYAVNDASSSYSGRLEFDIAATGSLTTRWTMDIGALYGATGGVYFLQSAGGVATPEHSWRGSATYGMTLVSSEILHSIAGSKTTGIEKTSNIPYMNLYRMDTHGTNIVGAFTFVGKDAAGTEAEYAQVMGYADSATGGSEVGSLIIKTATSASGALTTSATITAEGTVFDPGSMHTRQVVTSTSNQVNVDCENGYVVYHDLTENTEIQPPTNEKEPAELIFLIDGDGSSSVTFKAGSTAGGFWKESSISTIGASSRLTIKFIYDSANDWWVESSRTVVMMSGGS
jgi:hypothetical protein